TGIYPPAKFSTACAASPPGPGPRPLSAGKVASFGANLFPWFNPFTKVVNPETSSSIQVTFIKIGWYFVAAQPFSA
ncbi:MAG TPA: hypothetical protein VE545_02030, partial [Candidatus Dormibacteraeota bacterium]|nr:hypothetical protein [Candidatus Dormibacteraeota bacterium]